MPLVPNTNPDYSDKDFDSLRRRLILLIKSVFPEWTDFNVATFGNVLVDLFAHSGDVLTFYQDAQGRQSRILSATDRRAVLGLIKLIDYRASSAKPATVDVLISLPEPPLGDVLFPKGTIVSTEGANPVEYQLLADASILAGADPAEVSAAAENSETRTQQFSSTGLANQTVTLDGTPYIDDTAIPTAGNGLYEEKRNLLSSVSTDRHFTSAVDQNDRARLRFGNGVSGQIPVGTVSIEYKVGGGSAGRVQEGKLTVIAGNWIDSLGNSVQPAVTNPLASSGGTDRESVAQIKVRAPATVRAPTNSVANEDFEINAMRVPGVARALMLTSNEDLNVGENHGLLLIVPEGGGLPSSTLKAQVLTMVTVTYPCTLTFVVAVQDPLYLDIDIFAIVYLRKGAVSATVKAGILAALATFFAITSEDGTPNEAIGFGADIEEITMSDIQNAIRDVAGVRKVGAAVSDFTLNGVHDDVALQAQHFPRLGTVTLLNGETGVPL